MERYDQLFRLYNEFDTERVRDAQDFVDVFPALESRIAFEHWEAVRDELDQGKAGIAAAFDDVGDRLAEIAAIATEDQAFTALDLYNKYERAVNVLVLDVDETLRSPGRTDNEIPRSTLHLLERFHDADVPIVVCTGQTLENVKGFLIQGLGNEIVYSGDLSIVYESGTGVFTPVHGTETKQQLYDDLDADVREIFEAVRSRILSEAPPEVRRGCHLQGNEFNVTLKPNAEAGSDEARTIIADGLVHLVDLLGAAVAERIDDCDAERVREWTARHYAASDSEIAGVLEADPETPSDLPGEVADLFSEIDISYYEGDAAELESRELNKVAGTNVALDTLGVTDPFALVMGDSKTDLTIMEWAADNDSGISAAPKHASRSVIDHVIQTDELLFEPGQADEVLRAVYALDRIADIEKR